jgi:hypothetical protein
MQFPLIRRQAPAPAPAQPPRVAAPGWQVQPAANINAQPRFPVNAALAGDQTPRPTFRAQEPDAPAVATATPFVLPTPQQLGLAQAQATPAAPIAAREIDWNDVRARLHRLGAVGFHLDQVGGQWRAQLLVPINAQEMRTLESSAGNDAAAIAAVLQQAESQVARR